MSSNICLVRLVLNNPSLFYPQDWYYDEEFAYIPINPEFNHTAAALAQFYIENKSPCLEKGFYWTTDYDNRGNRVYLGGWGLSKLHPGLQIHRHLANPDVKKWEFT